MRKCVSVTLVFDNGDRSTFGALDGGSHSADDIRKFVDEQLAKKEPLIKDEKVRKAVRAWAEVLYENRIRFDRASQGFSASDGYMFFSINFDGLVFDLVDGKGYTIDELCGEEEE